MFYEIIGLQYLVKGVVETSRVVIPGFLHLSLLLLTIVAYTLTWMNKNIQTGTKGNLLGP